MERNQSIKRVDVSRGEVAGEIPVARSGDLLRVDNHLYSADMKTGIMSVVDLQSGKVSAIKTPEVDPAFDLCAHPAHAGFMQLAADPVHHRVERGRFFRAYPGIR